MVKVCDLGKTEDEETGSVPSPSVGEKSFCPMGKVPQRVLHGLKGKPEREVWAL